MLRCKKRINDTLCAGDPSSPLLWLLVFRLGAKWTISVDRSATGSLHAAAFAKLKNENYQNPVSFILGGLEVFPSVAARATRAQPRSDCFLRVLGRVVLFRGLLLRRWWTLLLSRPLRLFRRLGWVRWFGLKHTVRRGNQKIIEISSIFKEASFSWIAPSTSNSLLSVGSEFIFLTRSLNADSTAWHIKVTSSVGLL